MSVAGTIGFSVELGELSRDGLDVALRHVDAGADRGGAHVDGVEILFRVLEEADLVLERERKGVEFLADRHRHGVLQLGATHLGDFEELVAFRAERGDEPVQLGDQLVRCAAGRRP